LPAKAAQTDAVDLVTDDDLIIAAVAVKHYSCFFQRYHLVLKFSLSNARQTTEKMKGTMKNATFYIILISKYFHFYTDSVLHGACIVKSFFAKRQKYTKNAPRSVVRS